MEKSLIIVLVIAIIVFIVSIISIFLLANKKKISSLLYRMEISEGVINDNLKNKIDLVIRAINIIERELKIESKKFEKVKKIKSEKLNNIVIDNVLSEATKEIMEIKNDYKELSNKKSFDGIVKDINDLDILLTGGRKFYNKYTTDYNKLIKIFPNNLLKFNYKNLYSENDTSEDTKIDFTI